MAESDLEREGAIRWFDETLGSRLDDKKTGRVVVIEQRTHQADLSGHLLAQGGWEHLSLPAEFDRRTTIVMPRSLREVVKEEGQLLWPEREGRAELDAARLRLGDYAYQCQYLQQPVARGGNRFKREWFGTFRTMPQQFDCVVTAWDTAFRETETSDYSACVTIGYLGGRGSGGEMPGLYVLHAWHGRVPFSELKAKAKEFGWQWRPAAVVVEDAASGMSLLQELRIDCALPLHPMKVQGDKLVRAAAAEPTISAGRVMLPDGAPWTDEFLREVCAFPSAAHDDFVDALVYAIIFLRSAGAVLSESDRQFMASANQQLHSGISRGSNAPRGDTRGPAPEGSISNFYPDYDAIAREEDAQSSASARAWGMGRRRFAPGTW
jgi:predicted phage terminase large subunit-like protein